MPSRGRAHTVIVVASTAAEAEAAARPVAAAWLAERPSAATVPVPPTRTWPFTHPLRVPAGDHPLLLWMPDLHDAWTFHQQGGTRLVTTQAAYLLQTWWDAIGLRDALLLATVARDRGAGDGDAADLLLRRGPFAAVEIVDAAIGGPADLTGAAWTPPLAIPAPAQAEHLAAAFQLLDTGSRLAACVGALDEDRSPPALVATASACMEAHDFAAASRDLDEAVALAPDWPAARFERGKLWLRRDDLIRASDDFRAAAARMPGFGPAWANLGATLGELDRPDEALEAFDAALACDPASHQTVNNIGVLQRERGQLAASETAFRQVVALAPDLAFGYYNLGHTLFLQGRYQAALQAYVDGQRRDRDRNPVQATRLAMCRLASGDAAGALAELQRSTEALPGEYRRQLLDDTQAIAWAILTARPDVPGWRLVNDWLSEERQRLA
jgi:tetratricopeptide (TPR) repeat protein